MELNGDTFIEGIFIEESKNRFIGKVKVNGTIFECYIPSSSKLENFINIKNKRVLVTENKKKGIRTKYSLFGVFYRNRLIVLNLNIVNKLFQEIIKSGQYKEYNDFSEVRREAAYKGYKADILLDGKEKLVVENKALIDVKKAATFPTVYSERAIEQLEKLDKLLYDNCKVCYNFIALSPFINSVRINTDELEYYTAFMQCVNHGMQVNGYKLYFKDNTLRSERIKVNFQEYEVSG